MDNDNDDWKKLNLWNQTWSLTRI